VGLPLALCGCAYYPTYDSVAGTADRVAQGAGEAVQADRQSRLQRAARQVQTPGDQEERIRQELRAKYPDLNKLSLADTLRIATAYNRDLATARDANTLLALSYLQARHLFDPRLSGTVSFLESWAKDTATGADTATRSFASTGTLGVDYLTMLGTRIRTTLNSSNTHTETVSPTTIVESITPTGTTTTTTTATTSATTTSTANASSGNITVSQPLLRGAGRLVTREPLTQAERNLVYGLRTFELYRQDFTINTTNSFYGLVRDKQVITNSEKLFEQADFLYQRAQSLYKTNRAKELDVLQAEQQRLQAENGLRDAQESYKDALLAFKIFLGVPDDVTLDIRTDEIPELRKVQVAAEKAVQLALENRLDLSTASEQVADAERGVDIAHNGQLPDFALALAAGSNAATGARFPSQVFNNHSASAGVTFTAPLDRLDQHVAAEQARLNLDKVQRAYKLYRDSLASDVRRQLRNLLRIEQSMAVQLKIVTASQKRLDNAEYLFHQGTRTSLDVVQAQQDLLSARNQDIQFVVDHANARLSFLRALGLLVVNAEGLAQASDLFGPPEKRELPVKADKVPEEQP